MLKTKHYGYQLEKSMIKDHVNQQLLKAEISLLLYKSKDSCKKIRTGKLGKNWKQVDESISKIR